MYMYAKKYMIKYVYVMTWLGWKWIYQVKNEFFFLCEIYTLKIKILLPFPLFQYTHYRMKLEINKNEIYSSYDSSYK